MSDLLLLVLYVLASPLWLPPVVLASRARAILSWERTAAITLAVCSPLLFLVVFAAVGGYCQAASPGTGVIGEGPIWPNCDPAEPWLLASLAPATLVGLASWIIALAGRSRSARDRRGDTATAIWSVVGIGVAVSGLILGAGVGLVSETRRTDILAERQARMEEIASERSALIERRCVVAVPTELADYLYVGLRWGEQTYISVHDHHVEPTGLDSFAVAQVDFTRPAWLVRGTLYASEHHDGSQLHRRALAR